MFAKKHSMYFGDGDGSNGGATGTPPAGEKPPENSGKKPVTFESEEAYQADLEAKLKDRLEREKRKAEEAATKARKDAEDEAAKKNGEWQKLAEQREKDLAEANKKAADLEAQQAKQKRYEDALTKQLAALRKDLPAHILALLDKLDPADQLEYIAANADALKGNPAKGGAGSPPRPNNSGGQKPPEKTNTNEGQPLVRF